MGPGRAILQAFDAFGLEARHPLAHRFDGYAERGRDGRRRLSLDHHPPHQVGSTMRREPGVLMNVHPVLREDAEASQLQLPRSEPDGQPNESSQLEAPDCRGARCWRSTLTFTLQWKRRTAAAELRGDQKAGFARSLPKVSEHKFEREAVPQRDKAGGLDGSAYEQLVQSVVDYAIFMLDPEGHVSSWNPGAECIKGYTADEIIGEHFSRFYTPEDRDAGLPEHVLKQAAVEGRFVAEGWRVRKDGSHFWAAVVVDPIRQGDTLVGF